MGKRFTEEQILQAKDTDLVWLAESMGYQAVRKGNCYSLKEIDSIRIYNRRTFFRFSTGGSGRQEGGSAIDFLMLYGNLTFTEAVRSLLNLSPEARIPAGMPVQQERASFRLPEPAENNRRLFAYLAKTRGIPGDIIAWFVKQGLIYEEAAHHNIVFVSRDKGGTARHAFLRGTAGNFKCDVPGNDKNYGFNLVTGARELYVYEAAIDLISDLAMTREEETQPNRLALGMLSDQPLATFLTEHPQVERLCFCLDRDEWGQKAAGNLMKKYREQGYEVEDRSERLLKGGVKDFNELLLRERQEKKEGPPEGKGKQNTPHPRMRR